MILMINQFYNLNTDMETLTQYMVLLDRSNELATPLAVILTAPPASCACEAREDMTDYLISLLCLAGSRDFQYTTR